MEEVKLLAMVELIIDASADKTIIKVVSSDLKFSDNIDKKMYWDGNKLNTSGSKAFSNVLIQGLVSNIHTSHDNGCWDSAEHLRYIISELERGFVTIVKTNQKIKE